MGRTKNCYDDWGIEFDSSVKLLKEVMDCLDLDYSEIEEEKASVIDEYQPIFYDDNADIEDILSFLEYEKNNHWMGLSRNKSRLRENDDCLRDALRFFRKTKKNEGQSYQYARDNVNGMGKAITTAILTVMYPDTCGVWNRRSEEAMKQFKIWPEFERAASHSAQYTRVNTVLKDLAKELLIDLWTLDRLWWHISDRDEKIVHILNRLEK